MAAPGTIRQKCGPHEVQRRALHPCRGGKGRGSPVQGCRLEVGYHPATQQYAGQHRAERAVDGVYSVAINVHNFHAGPNYFSVKCSVASARRFRVTVFRVESLIEPGHEYHGEVCPASWVYHSYTVPNSTCGGLKFHVTKHTGDVQMVERHGRIPVKLVPPYAVLDEQTVEYDLQVCNVTAGEQVYVGMVGGSHCASYEISVTELPVGAACAGLSLDHATHAHPASLAHKTLEINLFEAGSCTPRGWYDYYFNVTDTMIAAWDNLLFEVEVLGGAINHDAVSLHLYEGSIPLDRHSERVATVPDNNIYAIGLSSQDVHRGTYYLSVHCGESAQRFDALAIEVRVCVCVCACVGTCEHARVWCVGLWLHLPTCR